MCHCMKMSNSCFLAPRRAATAQARQFARHGTALVYAPVLAVPKAVKLDCFTGWDRDSKGEESRRKRVVQHCESLCRVHHGLNHSTCQDATSFTGAIKAAEGRRLRGHFDSLEKTKAAAVILWRVQKTAGQIYDKMSNGDVNSSRRREVCERASLCLRLPLLDYSRPPLSFCLIPWMEENWWQPTGNILIDILQLLNLRH